MFGAGCWQTLEAVEEMDEGGAIGDVEPMEMKVPVTFELSEAPLLEPCVVGVVEIVHPDDTVPLFEQQLAYLRANETGATCD